MLSIKHIKNGQVFYGKAKDGSAHRFKAWGEPYYDYEVEDWVIDCTDEGDYCYTFSQTSEDILYPTEDLT